MSYNLFAPIFCLALHSTRTELWLHCFFSACSQVRVCVLLFTEASEVDCKFSLMLLLCIALAQCQKSQLPWRNGVHHFSVLQFALLRNPSTRILKATALWHPSVCSSYVRKAR